MSAPVVEKYASRVQAEQDEYQRWIGDQRKQTHRSVHSTAHSPCGSLFVAGLNDGTLCVWPIQEALSVDSISEAASGRTCLIAPAASFTAHPDRGAIFALAFSSDAHLLVSGGSTDIRVWSLDDVKSLVRTGESTEQIKPRRVIRQRLETNGVAFFNEQLIAVGGENVVHCFDCNTWEEKSVYSLESLGCNAPADYLHCCAVAEAASLVVCGSDLGLVSLWDMRQKGSARVIDMNTFEKWVKRRESRGSVWCSSLAVSPCGNWVVCGGGGARITSIFHAHSLTPTALLPQKATVSDVLLSRGNILTAGVDGGVYQWSMEGELMRRQMTHVAPISSISVDPSSERQVLVCGGSGSRLDVMFDFVPPSIALDVDATS